MAERIDYYINSDWDLEFTDWDDLKTARGDTVLLQNFVALVAEIVHPYVGENVGSTELMRLANQIQAQYSQRENVDSVNLRNLALDDNELSFSVVINSTELSDTIYL